MFLLDSQTPPAFRFWRARANASPEVTRLFCRIPLPALSRARGCAPRRPAAVSVRAPARARLFSPAAARRVRLFAAPRVRARAAQDALPRAPRAGVEARAPLPPPGGSLFPFAARPAPLRPGSLSPPGRNPSPRRPLAPKSATPSKICARAPSTRRRRPASPLARRPATRRPRRQGVGGACSALHFQRARVRQVRCDTLLPGCRPPWPPPCCPHPPAAFRSVRPRGPLSLRAVRPALRPLLTSARPRGAPLRARSQFEAPLVRSTARLAPAPAVLRDISPGTSYQAVRWVFRRYARLPGPICTSGPLGASAGASPAVARGRRSSPPFGPRRPRSPRSSLPLRPRRAPRSPRSARARAALLGPCFKTGRPLAPAARASASVSRLFTPLPRVFSPFPRGTSPLSAYPRV